MNRAEKIAYVREQLAERKLDAYVVFGRGPHGLTGDFLPARWREAQWLTETEVSPDCVVITQEHAVMWFDVNTARELAGDELYEVQSFVHYFHWLSEVLEDDATIGMDGWTLSAAKLDEFFDTVGDRGIAANLHCDLWPERPAMPDEPIWDYPATLAGGSREDRLQRVRDHIERYGCQYGLLSEPDDVAWVLNIRGRGIPCTPLPLCYALIGLEHAVLFVVRNTLPDALVTALEAVGVEVDDYDHLESYVALMTDEDILWVDAKHAPATIAQVDGPLFLDRAGCASWYRGEKNAVEITAHHKGAIREAAAFLGWWRWLVLQGHSVPEVERGVAMYHELCSAQPEFFDLSRRTRLVYHTGDAANSTVALLAGGSHFRDGATSLTTRVVAIGEPSAEHRRHCSLLLKGLIALATAVWPYRKSGVELAALCYAPAWKQRVQTSDDIGHFFGAFLGTRERSETLEKPVVLNTPSMVSSGFFHNELQAGSDEDSMCLSNMLYVVPATWDGSGNWTSLETTGLVPFDRRLIDVSLLSADEIAWIDDYHARCVSKVSPHLPADDRDWLGELCRPLEA